MTYNEALSHGMEVIRIISSIFYNTNEDNYKTIGYDQKDVEQYLYSTVLINRFLTTIEHNPGYYKNRASYRSSLYTSCRRTLMAHYKMHFRTQSRMVGNAVCLDEVSHDEDEFVRNEVPSIYGINMDDLLKKCSDALPHNRCGYLARYIICFLFYGSGTRECITWDDKGLIVCGRIPSSMIRNKSSLVKRLRGYGFTSNEVDDAMDLIWETMEYICDSLPNIDLQCCVLIPSNIYDPIPSLVCPGCSKKIAEYSCEKVQNALYCPQCGHIIHTTHTYQDGTGHRSLKDTATA